MKLVTDIKQIQISDNVGCGPCHLNVIELDSSLDGPHLYIQANVHGAEIQGNAVIFRLLNLFKTIEFKGKITLVPMANPLSINNKIGTSSQGRYNPVTGNNWNRNYYNLLNNKQEINNFAASIKKNTTEEEIVESFKNLLSNLIDQQLQKHDYGISQNKYLNLKLQQLATKADFVLDLHTGPVATEYIYAADYTVTNRKVCDLKFPHVISIPPEFAGAMDEASFCPWVYLYDELKHRGHFYQNNFEAYTLELGSEEIIDLDLAYSQALKIIHFMHKRNLCELPDDFNDRCEISNDIKYSELAHFKTYFAPASGNIEYLKSPGEKVSKGDKLFNLLNFTSIDKNNIDSCLSSHLAAEDAIIINHCPSGTVQEGMEVYQVLENIKSL